MTKRKMHTPEFKAKVALEAIREEMTLAELSKSEPVNAIGPNEPANGVHQNQISTWSEADQHLIRGIRCLPNAATRNMATAFTRRGSDPGKGDEAEIEKLHSKIGQLVVERDFLANGLPCKPPPVRGAGQTLNCSGREAKNGEQGA
jgi:transposase